MSAARPWHEKYELVVGLEVHAQLLTNSKAYSSDANAYGDHPNTLVSPVTLGLPGTLPVPNKQVIDHAIALGRARTQQSRAVAGPQRKDVGSAGRAIVNL